MNNWYKGNLSLGNYTFENKEKLEFQTHGFTGEPNLWDIFDDSLQLLFPTNIQSSTSFPAIICQVAIP